MLPTTYNHRTFILVVVESLLLIAAVFLISGWNSSTAGPALTPVMQLGKIILIAAIIQLSLYYHDLYDLNRLGDKRDVVLRLIKALLKAAVLFAVIDLIWPGLILTPVIWLYSAVVLLILLLASRLLLRKIETPFQSRVLIVGTGDMAIAIAREILGNPRLGITICGFLGEDRSAIGRSLVNPTVIGTVEDLERLAARERVDHILVALPNRRGRVPLEALLNLKVTGVQVEEGELFFEKAFGKLPVEQLHPGYLVFSEGFHVSRFTRLYKRIFSIILSIIGLIVTAPLMLATAIAIKLDSRGPVFFTQERVGEDGRVFKLIKFRSMYSDAEARTGPVWAHTDDPRITRVGRFIRCTRIDELPQFFNVLKSDMHFVGPRPERPYFVEQLRAVIPYYWQRHTVKPGITGWAQIRYPYSSTVEEAREKLKYDLYYIKNVSLLLDLMIIFETVKTVLLRRGAK